MSDLAEMVADGMTYNEIAAELSLPYERTRQKLNRKGLYPKHEASKTLRDRVEDMKPYVAVEYLLGVVEELALVAPDKGHPVDDWGLTRCQSRIAKALHDFRGAGLSKENLYSAIYFDRADADDLPSPKIVDVFVCSLRKKIPPHVKIETVWGEGYRMVIE